jgi:hypothetical protein
MPNFGLESATFCSLRGLQSLSIAQNPRRPICGALLVPGWGVLIPLTPAWLYNPYMTRVRPRILRVAAGVEY